MPPLKRIKRRYPPLPKHVCCPGGDVPILLVTQEEINKYADEGESLLGLYDPGERKLLVLKSLSMEQKHRFLWHELIHVGLEDAGIRASLGTERDEAIADALSSLMMRALFG